MIYRSIAMSNNYHKYIVLEKASIGVRTLDTSLCAIHPGSLRSGYVTRFMNSFHVLTWCDSKSSLFYCEIYYIYGFPLSWQWKQYGMWQWLKACSPTCQIPWVYGPGSATQSVWPQTSSLTFHFARSLCSWIGNNSTHFIELLCRKK